MRIVGDFEISIDTTTWYKEKEFCLLEFASPLAAWLESISITRPDFVYRSIESDEPELIRFEPIGVREWRILSPHQNLKAPQAVPESDVIFASEDYLRRLLKQLPEREKIFHLLKKRPQHEPLIKWFSTL